MFFFGLFVGKNLKERKKRVKKLQSIFTKSLHYFSRKKGDAPQYTDTYRYTHKSPFSSAQKSASRRVERKKKARRRFEKTTTKKTVVVARLSGWSFASTGKARKRREKVLLRLLFFFSSRIFCVFPEVKNTTTRGGDRKSPKRSKKRALYHQSHEDRDGRPRRERKDPKGGKVKEAPTEGVGEDQKRGGLPREREKGRPKKERTHNQKGFVFGTTF